MGGALQGVVLLQAGLLARQQLGVQAQVDAGAQHQRGHHGQQAEDEEQDVAVFLAGAAPSFGPLTPALSRTRERGPGRAGGAGGVAPSPPWRRGLG
ncbi:hypothetical protein GCM10027019_23080 [Melaminivora jejuensis]